MSIDTQKTTKGIVVSLINKVFSKGIKLWEDDNQLKMKAPKGSLTNELREELVENKQEIIAFLQQITVTDNIQKISPVDKTKVDFLPLSFVQQRLWFIDQLEPDSANYNITGAFILNFSVDINLLEYAFNLIIARHDNLRTVFPSQDGQARQLICDNVDFKLKFTDLSHYRTDKTRLNKAKILCNNEANFCFRLAQGPLLRGQLIKLTEDQHIIMLNMHHIISDGWSMGVLMNELGIILDNLHQGKEIKLPTLPIQYADYSIWQRQLFEQEGLLEKQLTYWENKLSGVPESLDMATDYSRSRVRSFDGASFLFNIESELTGQLKKLTEQQGVTLFMSLLATFKVLLHRYTGKEDICIGSPIANRQHEETEGLIGMFVNTLALRSLIRADDTFTTVLAKVKKTCLEAYEYQDTPFEKIVDRLHVKRNLAISPLFQIMVILQNTPMETNEAPIQEFSLDNDISKFDLTVQFTETSEGISGSIQYNTSLYMHQTIERLIGHFINLCHAIIASPDARIGELNYISQPEKHQLLTEFNETKRDYPRDKCVHQLFIEQVKCAPKKIAISFQDEQLTYQQLYDRSHELALYLQSKGVKPDTLVGVFVERSIDMMVGILGILQAGGAYIPLEPDYPDDRLAYMLEDSHANIVLTQDQFKEKIVTLTSAASSNVHIISLDKQWSEIHNTIVELNTRKIELISSVKPNNLAYVLYTSGSTGKPKGVMVEHKALMNRAYWTEELYSLHKDDVVLQKTPYSFDVSVWEILWPVMTGVSLVLAEPGGHKDVFYLENIINKEKITTLHFVPSMMQSFLTNAQNICKSVRQVFCGGESLGKNVVEDYKNKFPNASLYNWYGPTETTIDATSYECTKADRTSVLIGFPISNTQIYILDSYNNPVPVGVPGELHIAGDGLARGYLNRAELTLEKFIDNPFEPNTRLYKSGDLARWLEDGSIEYMGRIDTQVKIRGFRIEVGEIETQLNEFPAIKDSVVVAKGEEPNKQLIAFYLTDNTSSALVVEEIREHLQQSLPEFMIPQAFVPIEIIPLTPNGKVNRRALESIEVSFESKEKYLAPSNDTEKQLVDIWAQVLKLDTDSIGTNANFFELGGHSLSAVQLLAKINNKFNQSLPLSILFTAPNISALALLILNDNTCKLNILVPIQTKGNERPIFAIPGVGGNVLSLQPLSHTFGDEQPFYGIQAVGFDGKTPPLDSVVKTAKVNVAALQSVQPNGPYRLIGHSYGGVVAYEMANILQGLGEKIEFLVMLDTIAPQIRKRKENRDEVTDLFEICEEVANLHGVPLNLDIEELEQLSANTRKEYVVDKLKEYELEINIEQFNTFYNIYKANDLCYRTYDPIPLSKSINSLLFRAETDGLDITALPEDYGWGKMFTNQIHTFDIKAGHFTMLEIDYNQDIVKEINHMIRK